MSGEIVSLLRALVGLTGRAAFSEEDLLEIIGQKSNKLLVAYNLCDGTRTQQEISGKTKLDSGNFSRTVGRWIEAGIVFRIEAEDKITLLHVYPLSKGSGKKNNTTSALK